MQIIIACLIAFACAEKDASVVKSEQDVGIDNFNYAYETSNGITAHESGSLKGESIDVTGEFSFTAPDGTKVKVAYTADESGFHPVGDHLPVAPEVPEYIARAIKLLPIVESRRR